MTVWRAILPELFVQTEAFHPDRGQNNISTQTDQAYPGSRGPNAEREGDSKRKTPKQREGPLASAVENLTSMSVFGSDFEPCL